MEKKIWQNKHCIAAQSSHLTSAEENHMTTLNSQGAGRLASLEGESWAGAEYISWIWILQARGRARIQTQGRLSSPSCLCWIMTPRGTRRNWEATGGSQFQSRVFQFLQSQLHISGDGTKVWDHLFQSPLVLRNRGHSWHPSSTWGVSVPVRCDIYASCFLSSRNEETRKKSSSQKPH